MIYAYFICIAWGISYYLANKIAKLGISYPTFNLFLFPFSLSLMMYNFYSNTIKTDFKIIRDSDSFYLIIFYIIFNLLGNFLAYMAMKTVDPFTVSILELGYPVVILIIMIFMSEIKFNVIHLIGIFFTFFGIFLILKES